MKKLFILPFVLVLGVVVMVGCGGDGDGAATVPQSAATYTGPEQPAMLDSTTNTQNLGVNFLSDLSRAAMQFGGGIRIASLGSTSASTSDFVEGGDGGSYTYSGSSSSSWDETSLHTSVVQSLSFSDFADSRGVYISYPEGPGGIINGKRAVRLAERPGTLYYQDLQAGRGAAYRSITSDLTTDGIPVEEPIANSAIIGPVFPRPVGSLLTDKVVSYMNYNAFYTSEGYEDWGFYEEDLQRQILQSGFASANNMGGPLDTTTMHMPFNDTLSADYARDYFYSVSNTSPYQSKTQYTQALLGFNQNHAWDLSTATFSSSGTYCAEGDLMGAVLGCVDFDVSLTWDHDADTRGSCRYWGDLIMCYGWPEGGSATLMAGDASASFAFTPTGGTFTFDAGNGSDPFETNLTAPLPD